MRRIVWVSLFALLATGASAQRQGGVVRGFGGGGNRFRPAFAGRRTSGYLPGGYGYGYLGGGYSSDEAGSSVYAPQPVIWMQPPPAPAVVEPPPPPARPVMTNYKWPAAVPSVSADDAQTFGIVLKNGSIVAASAVVAADDGLHLVDSDEQHLRVSMRDVDRSATMKLNRERRLSLYLPASPR
jgi:hypothetical protein